MNATRTHGSTWQANPASGMYLGWSHRNARLEMMDLPGYLDSLRQGFDTLQQGYRSAVAGSPASWYAPASSGTGSQYPSGGWAWGGHQRAGHDHRHDHGCDCGDQHESGHEHESGRGCGCGHRPEHGSPHHHQHGAERGDEHGCGCDDDRDCRCECCVSDADIVVYARCGEVRVVPIEIENDTRKVREDVTVELSEVRTAGGRTLSWSTVLSPEGPLTLQPCSTTKLEVLVRINCGQDAQADKTGSDKAGSDKAGSDKGVTDTGRDSGDVDRCVVGYLTLRLGGCVTRPIVLAVAVLPDSCGSYRTSCSCSCCC